MTLKTKHGGPVGDGLWKVGCTYSRVENGVRYLSRSLESEGKRSSAILTEDKGFDQSLELDYQLTPLMLIKWSD